MPWCKREWSTGWPPSIRRKSTWVVTHSMVSRIIRGTYLGLDPDEMLRLTHPHTAIFVLNHGDSRCHEAEMEC